MAPVAEPYEPVNRARGEEVNYGLSAPTIHMAKNWEPPP